MKVHKKKLHHIKPRPVGRPRDLDKREAIVAAAWDLFLADGVKGASLEQIAKAAGASRVTLYSHFPDKAALFEETIRQAMARLATTQTMISVDETLREVLTRFGNGLMHFLVAPEASSFYAVLAGELRQNPALARAFYEAGPAVTLKNLSAIMSTAIERGQIKPCSAETSAEHLIGLWLGASHYQIALGVDLDQLVASIPERVWSGVDVFLVAYAAREASQT